jgi:hypothetical protein
MDPNFSEMKTFLITATILLNPERRTHKSFGLAIETSKERVKRACIKLQQEKL